jgi:hypothetical protein
MKAPISRAAIFLLASLFIKPWLALMLWLNMVSTAGVHAATMADVSANLVKLNAPMKGIISKYQEFQVTAD